MIEVLPILTERLTLRKFREDDAVAFHGWRNDPAVARYTLWDCPYPIEEAERFCHEQASLAPFPEGAYYQLMIVEKATGGPVGDIGVGNGVTPEGLGNVRIGYTLSPKGQGKGYMTEALRALLPALVTPLKVSKFSADIDVRNPASGRVLERVGFKAKGPVQLKRTFVKGEWCDEQEYELEVQDLISRNKE
ncbi:MULTISPECIES: GNAT family N-acetyltransferase [Kordiimonas]|jgi:RimJ/RimL family protein N-acetyltransferase|uniref:GNAT family N-acetyltransferase n=1 Tax=Kordiimonas TaxID=288021 RepID=UPI00257AF1CB|nr:GNAT family N-acetyltransferase [Kordiimonas sp. UBA4487]